MKVFSTKNNKENRCRTGIDNPRELTLTNSTTRSWSSSTKNCLLFYFTLLLIGTLPTCSLGEGCRPVFNGPQIGSIGKNEVKIYEGSSFNLSCTLSQTHAFTWRINRSLHLSDYDKSVFSVVTKLPQNGIIVTELFVSNITRELSGDYSCVMGGCHSSSSNQSITTGLTIQVIYAQPPVISHSGRNEYSEIQIKNGTELRLKCVTDEYDPSLGFAWQKEVVVGGESEWMEVDELCSGLRKGKKRCYVEREESKEESNRVVLFLSFNETYDEDFGNYSCGIPITNAIGVDWGKSNDFVLIMASSVDKIRTKRGGMSECAEIPKKKEDGVIVDTVCFTNSDGKEDRVRVTKKFEKGTNSTIGVEGTSVSLSCNLVRGGESGMGMRYKVAWRIDEKYYTESEIEGMFEEIDGKTVGIFKYIETPTLTNLTINSLKLNQSGYYQCALWDSRKGPFNESLIVSSFEILLRTRAKLGPLYPFVAIIAEASLLFFIILCYEKRKSKMEIEESDTDGSPEQDEMMPNKPDK